MKRENYTILILSVPSLIALFTMAFEWSIDDWITPFLLILLEPAVFAILAVAFLISTIFLCRKQRFRQPKYYVPIVATLAFCAAAEFVPFTAIWLHANFLLYKQDREQIAAKIFSGELTPNISYNQSLIALPPEYKKTSMGGGDVVVEDFVGGQGVYFFTFRGILGKSTGYLYMNSDIIPSGLDIVSATQVAPRWFMISTR